MNVILRPVAPYDFNLAVRLFGHLREPGENVEADIYSRIILVAGTPVLISARADGPVDEPAIKIETYPSAVDKDQLLKILNWHFNADADLKPFYKLAAKDKVIGPLTQQLYGLKPMRVPSLLEMLVIAITEQQISLRVGHIIQGRIIERFGEGLTRGGVTYFAFPTAAALATAAQDDLLDCGLSHAKVRYIQNLAQTVVSGEIDLDKLSELSNDRVMETLVALDGIGPWTAEYTMERGLGRFDVVPADDLGVQRAIGAVFGDGRRATAAEVRRTLERWGPHKGWVVFYLFAAGWLSSHSRT
jgi:DNA-3-methyladenine glycosylase II